MSAQTNIALLITFVADNIKLRAKNAVSKISDAEEE